MLLLPEWVGSVLHGTAAVLYCSVPVTLGVIEWRDAFITVILGGEGETGSCRHATVACSLQTLTQRSASLYEQLCNNVCSYVNRVSCLSVSFVTGSSVLMDSFFFYHHSLFCPHKQGQFRIFLSRSIR